MVVREQLRLLADLSASCDRFTRAGKCEKYTPLGSNQQPSVP
jgi:hypothetical protein